MITILTERKGNTMNMTIVILALALMATSVMAYATTGANDMKRKAKVAVLDNRPHHHTAHGIRAGGHSDQR